MKSLNNKIKVQHLHVKKNNKRYHHKFLPNYFISKQLGGLGLENQNHKKIFITNEQRKVATYFARNPSEVFLIEKLNSEPSSCADAINLFRKIRPNVESWLIEGKPVQGPLNKMEDPDVVSEKYLQYCLQLKSWVVNRVPIEELNMTNYNIRKALNSNEALMSYRKILRPRHYRFKIFDYNSSIPPSPPLIANEISLTDDFPDMELFWDL